jgi:predicted DNA-binding protein (MmcQ/YjbR family)
MDAQRLRQLCLSLPGATEDIKWGNDLCFLVGEKMFCVTGVEGPPAFTVKVPDEQFEEWCERPGVSPAPYLARAKWIQVKPEAKLRKGEMESLVRTSYALITAKLPAKVRKSLEA